MHERRWRLPDGDVDLIRGVVRRGDDETTLTTQELQLLTYLISRRGEAMHRDDLLRNVWGYEGRLPASRAPDFAIKRLRGKIEPDPTAPVMLLTVRGHGYRLEEPPASGEPEAATPVHGTLPPERDAFVGREVDLSALDEHLRSTEARAVCLLGPAGVGKTRLAVHYAGRNSGRWPGGVWFCDLTEARSVEGIAAVVARSLDVSPGGKPIARLGHAIAARGECLVILDNAEGVTEHLPQVVLPWLDRAPRARILLTSRHRPDLGEQVVSLTALSPDAARELFCTRAATVDPAGRASLQTDPELEGLLEALDRLPLAIELAAVRSRILSPGAMRSRLEDRFRLLGARRDDPGATLRAALDWSWELLSDPERAALAQVSVFEGGFDLDAAEAVISVDPEWPLEVLEALVDKSLVRVGAARRFGLLASIQAYAAEKLDDGGEAEARHGAHYAGLHELDADGQRVDVPQVELDNVIVACRRAVARQDPQVAVDTLDAAWMACATRGPFEVVPALASDVVELAGLSAEQRMRTTHVLGRALDNVGRMDEAIEALRECLALAEALDRPVRQARVYRALGMATHRQGNADLALEHLQTGLEYARRGGDLRIEGTLLGELGNILLYQGKTDEGLECIEEAVRLHREVGARHLEGISLAILAHALLQLDRRREAQRHFETALPVLREQGNRAIEAIVAGYLGELLAGFGELDRAAKHLRRALKLAREVGDPKAEATALENLGRLHERLGQLDEAQRQLRAALEVARGANDLHRQCTALGHLGRLNRDLGHPAEARRFIRASLELARSTDDRRSEARFLVDLADLERSQGRGAEELSRTAVALAREMGESRTEAMALAVAGDVKRDQGDLPAACRSYESAAELAARHEHRDVEAHARARLATLHLDEPE